MARKHRKHLVPTIIPKKVSAFIVGGFTLFALSAVGLTYAGAASASTTIASIVPYTWINWPASPAGFQSLQWSVTPLTDPSPDGYFWSTQFWLTNGGSAAYFGLQTNGGVPGGGKVAIFSVWNAIASKSPLYAATFGGEGVGYTARIKFPWQVGTKYNLQIQRLNIVASGTYSVASTSSRTNPVIVSWSGQSAFPNIPAGQVVYLSGRPYTTNVASTDGSLHFAAGTTMVTKGAVVFSQSIAQDPYPHAGIPTGTWWGAWIWQDGTSNKQFVGEVEVPAAWGNMASVNITSWTERYSGPLTSCASIRPSTVDFTNYIANGSLTPSSFANTLATSPGCNTTYFITIPGGAEQHVGQTPPH